MTKGCTNKIKGGERCGRPLVSGHKYCELHAPKDSVIQKVVKVWKQTKTKVEKTITIATYDAYLKSAGWKEKAKQEKTNNPRCSLCYRKITLHVHHRTYARCGSEAPGDLVVLCSECHELFHQYYKYDNRKEHFVRK